MRRSTARPLAVCALISVLTFQAGGRQASHAPQGASGQEDGSGLLDVGGAKLYYETRGNGLAVVLIHDGLVHRETWDRQWEALSKQHRVIRYDRRGYGRSEPPRQPYSDVEDLHALLRHLRVGRATLVGSSAGGNLVMEYALAHPQVAERLVLVGPVVYGLGFSEHFQQRNRENLRPLVEKKDVAATIANWVRDPYIIAPGNDEARKRLEELLVKNPHNLTHPFNFTKPPERPTLSRLGEIKAPTLIVVGEADIPDVHAHAGAIQAGIPNARRVIIPKAGHLPYAERAEDFNRIVFDFLGSP